MICDETEVSCYGGTYKERTYFYQIYAQCDLAILVNRIQNEDIFDNLVPVSFLNMAMLNFLYLKEDFQRVHIGSICIELPKLD